MLDLPSERIAPRSLTEVFLDTLADQQPDVAPLTPFMLHTARQAGVTEKELREPKRRETFLYWFYDTLHRLRAPYRWPVSPRVLDWLNAPSIRCDHSVGDAPGRAPYLTRFMAHVWSAQQRGWDVRRLPDCLRFLSWFAFECAPAWNLPPVLIPEELLALLNEAVCDASVPLTLAMAVRVQMIHPERFGTLEAADDAQRIAMSFAAVTEVLRTGDPRLLPPFVSNFWCDRPDPDSPLTRYEYVASRAWCPEDQRTDRSAARTWFLSRYVPVAPGADIFAPPDGMSGAGAEALSGIRPAPQAIFVYRDQHTVCGTARAGKMVLEALRPAPLPVHDIGFTLGRGNMQEEFKCNERQQCAARRALHVLCLNPEYVPECLASHISKIAETDYLIGHFYWELSDLGLAHHCALSLVDEIWVASEYLRELYTRHTQAPVIVIGQAVEVEHAPAGYSRSSLGLPEDAYLFLSTLDAGSVLERKNPLAALQAFQKAFPAGFEKAGFVLKVMNTSAMQTNRDRAHWQMVLQVAAQDRRIRILDRTLSGPEIAALNDLCDCYVSLHRSEGFGLGPAEALARGKPVIATAYSGTADFCTTETAMPVTYTLVEVDPGSYPYMDPGRKYCWADPDVEAAGACMRELYLAPEKGLELGRCGKKLMAERYSVAALGQRCHTRLRDLGFLTPLP